MFLHFRIHSPLWRMALLTLAVLSLALLLPRTAQPQGHPPGHVICSSNGGHVFCYADTAGGVSLERQMYDSNGCIKDQTWGYDDRGIWVDRGCSGEFVLIPPQAAPSPFLSRIAPGTIIVVRTQEWIDAHRYQERTYPAVVDQDVIGENGVVAIRRGAPVELMVREAPDHDLVLDLEAVIVNGQRYMLESTERLPSAPGIGPNANTAEHVGGGALLGSIVGAIAGGGKGAAIGAGAGAAAGAGEEMLTRGPRVHVPPESVLTFRLERPLVVRAFPPRG
jgi:hypothetical protein